MIGEVRIQTKSEGFDVVDAKVQTPTANTSTQKMTIFGLGFEYRDVLLASSFWKFERAF